jgi:hypothetical protein
MKGEVFMRWEVRVNPSTVTTRLRVRKGPSTSFAIVNWKYPNQGANIVDSKVTNGATWYKWEGTEYWSCAKTANGTEYLLKMRDLEEKSDPTPPNSPTKKPENKDITIDPMTYHITDTKFENNGQSNSDSSWYQPMMAYGNTEFDQVDYNDYSELAIANNIAAIKHNMDISYTTLDDVYDNIWTTGGGSGYFSDLQKKMYNSFNRNKTAFPDKNLNKTFAYVFFTRPDLNILTVGSGSTNLTLNDENVGCDPKYKYLWKNNPWCLKSLVSAGNPYHKFMVLLSNEALSFEVGDVVLKTMEHGETYNGNKIIYGRSDQESNAAGEMSIRYIDTVNLDIFKLHLVWTDYINKNSSSSQPTHSEERLWSALFKNYAIRLSIFSIVLYSIIALATILRPFVRELIPYRIPANIVMTSLTFLVMAPFLKALFTEADAVLQYFVWISCGEVGA